MTHDEAQTLNRRLNAAAVGTNSTLKELYVDDVERGTVEWDHLAVVGGTVLDRNLQAAGDRAFRAWNRTYPPTWSFTY